MSKLFGGQAPPAPETPPVAPVADDELTRVKNQRDYSRKYGGKGRSGTVLTQGTTLG